jgi:hypothetical protein
MLETLPTEWHIAIMRNFLPPQIPKNVHKSSTAPVTRALQPHGNFLHSGAQEVAHFSPSIDQKITNNFNL